MMKFLPYPEAAQTEDGDIGLSRRYLMENNNGRFVGRRFGSGFVASFEVVAKEIFSRVSEPHGALTRVCASESGTRRW
jgi:hypothetical protein